MGERVFPFEIFLLVVFERANRIADIGKRVFPFEIALLVSEEPNDSALP